MLSIKRRYLLPILAVSLTAFVVAAAYAQAGVCPGTNCIDDAEFATDADGWEAYQASYGTPTTLTWLASKTFGFGPFTSTANGVLQATGGASGSAQGIRQTLALSPGTYRLAWRMASDGLWGADYTVQVYTPDGSLHSLGNYRGENGFKQFTSVPQPGEPGYFTVADPGDVIIEILNYNGGTSLYFDYVWLLVDTSAPATATPAAGTPSATPAPAITSTPLPSATAYCISITPTPTGPGNFSLTPSPVPTTVPDLANWAVLDQFGYAQLASMWNVTGDGVAIKMNSGRPGEQVGSVMLPYSLGAGPYEELARNALVYPAPQGTFELSFWVDGWARDKFLPSGLSSYIEIWTLDPSYSGAPRWAQAEELQVSSGAWYPFHYEVTAQAGEGSSGTIAAIAFLSRRSDDLESGGEWGREQGVYLDDVYIYGNLSLAHRCDGSYPDIATEANGVSIGDNSSNFVMIDVPIDQPCPTPYIYVPNNFWGMLISEVHLLYENVFASVPSHAPGQIVQIVQDMLLSPIGMYFVLLSILFDLKWPVIVAGIWVVIHFGFQAFLLWKAARHATFQ